LALIPLIEGAITRIGSQSERIEIPIIQRVDGVANRAIETAARLHFENMWVPREYLTKDYLFGQDERVFVFETFRRWLNNSFFRNTGEYDGATWLNRHLFAHAEDMKWQESANFSRLVVALATLGVIESWHDQSHKVSIMFPDINEDSKLLWQQALLRVRANSDSRCLSKNTIKNMGGLFRKCPQTMALSSERPSYPRIALTT
jgi:hypothetical protein